MPQLYTKLPSLYHRLLPELAQREVPAETFATCDNCVLCQKEGSPYLGTKCCTYYPELPNYLIGGILQDERPEMQEGKRRLRAIIASRLGVTPYGLVHPFQYALLDKTIRNSRQNQYDWTREEVATLRCPFYNQGWCTVWDYREHCCSTHFCTSVGGEAGQKFWNALDEHLLSIEQSLSRHALLELSFPVEQLQSQRVASDKLNLDNAIGQVNEPTYSQLWGTWAGREEELYQMAYQCISTLSQQEVMRTLGVQGELQYKQLAHWQRAFLQPEIPEHLSLNKELKVEPLPTGEVELKTSAGSFKVPGLVYRMLLKLDTNYTVDSLEESLAPFGFHFKQEYLHTLFFMKVVVPAEA